MESKNLENILESYFDRLWPLTRSLTGNANRETLSILSEIIPLNVHEVPSGTICYDWEIPSEWNPKEAWIKDENGNILVDFKKNNLHLLGYSTSYNGKLSFEELESHLYSLPEKPELIPYVTSYYSKRWGFCISHHQLKELKEHKGPFNVNIDAEHNIDGSLTYGDLLLEGTSSEEILFSTYICHPSMANDQISGMLVAAFLYQELSKIKDRHYSYRFIFVPETIGAIAYLKENGSILKERTRAGYIITCLGDKGKFSYKNTKQKDSLTNKVTLQVLKDNNIEFQEFPFVPLGSDERQYASPGFNLPVGSLMRTMYWHFEEYHTSADNKSFISFKHLRESIELYMKVIKTFEGNKKFINKFPYGEVQLGKRGLYPTLGRGNDKTQMVDAYIWILNYSDGKNDLLQIAELSNIPMNILIEASNILEKEGLINKIENF